MLEPAVAPRGIKQSIELLLSYTEIGANSNQTHLMANLGHLFGLWSLIQTTFCSELPSFN